MSAKKNSNRILLLSLSLSFILLCVIVILFILGQRIAARHAPLVDAAMEIKLEATVAHLWFEEIMSGDRNEDIESVWHHLDKAMWYATVMLDGGENEEGVFLPVESPELRNQIESVRKNIQSFKEIAKERYNTFNQAAPGTDIDQQFDKVFMKFFEDADQVETQIQETIKDELFQFQLSAGLLIAFSIITSILLTTFIFSREKSRNFVLQTLSETETALKKSEEKYRLLAEYSPDMIYKMSLPEGIYEYVSPASNEVFGYSPKEWTNNPKLITKILPEDWQSYFIEEWKKLLENNAPPTYEYEINHKDGSRRWINQRNYVLFDDHGHANGLIGVVNDVTEKKSIELKLINSEKHLLAAQNLANLGSWELDITTNKLSWSDQVFNIFEIDNNIFEASYEGFLNTIHPEDRDMVKKAYKASIDNKSPFSIEHRLMMPDGRVKHVLENAETVFNDQGNPILSIGVVLDISARKESEEEVLKAKQDTEEALEKVIRVNLDLQREIAYKNQIEHQLNQYTNYDSLTTLPNQVSLLKEGKEIVERSINEEFSIGCCFINLIGLNEINLNYGRELGDAAIVETALKLKEFIRDLGSLYRFGGNKFILLIQNIDDKNNLELYLNGVQNTINSPLESIKNFTMSSNVGISLSNKGDTEIQKLIYKANNAMYEAKKQGENTCAFYSDNE